jgi:hypothetical protein
MSEEYKAALKKLRSELSAALRQRTEIDDRIINLQQSIQGIEALTDNKDHSSGLAVPTAKVNADEAGITEAIRGIIRDAMMPIKPPGIRDALIGEGFDPKDYSNILTVIHNTLNRLEHQGEIRKMKLPAGGYIGWMWAGKK